MLSLQDLRTKLYEKYKRKDIAKKLNKSPVQTSRLLSGYSKISLEQYNILIKMLWDKLCQKYYSNGV